MDNSDVVFTELPYAAALEDKFLKRPCSHCFASAGIHCKCYNVVYCDEKCMDSDAALHAIECVVSPSWISSTVRLMARYVVRRRLDGGSAMLPTNFPSNVKNRTCKDLTSHYSNMKTDKRRRTQFDEIWRLWRDYIGDRIKPTLGRSEVERVYCIICINTFGISDSNDANQKYPWNGIGHGLYLNVSRFNHSCKPDLYVDFGRNRLRVMKRKRDDWIDGLSERRFNRLTIDYGVPPSDSYGSDIALAKQRVDSLRRRYYFTCRCSLCSDRLRNTFETRAAIFEFPRCEVPYVRSRSTAKLKHPCPRECKVGVDPSIGKMMRAEKATIKQLDRTWDEVMADAARHSADNDKVIASRLPLWSLAKKYWHPITNLRFGQSSWCIFRACSCKLQAQLNAGVEKRSVELAIETGEATITSYASRLRRNTSPPSIERSRAKKTRRGRTTCTRKLRRSSRNTSSRCTRRSRCKCARDWDWTERRTRWNWKVCS